MSDFLKLAAERYSVRSFRPEPVAAETLEAILEAGRIAPTACNLQPQRVLVIEGDEAREKLPRCTKSHFGAPTALLVCCNTKESWRREYDGKPSGDIDAAIVTTHMMLAAASLGVGSTWVMHFDPEAIRREFAIPPHIEPVALLVMGYPAADAAPAPGHSKTRPAEETILRGSF